MMTFLPAPPPRRAPGRTKLRFLLLVVVLLRFGEASVFGTVTLRAGGMSGLNEGSGNAKASSAPATQTSSAATAATAQAAGASVSAQKAQADLAKSTAALQAQMAAQKAGVNPIALPPVANGLAPGGLVPGLAGIDTPNPVQVAVPVPIVVNPGGGASVTLEANTALTLPTQTSRLITLSAGSAGTLTTGGTIAPLKPGVATAAAPGSTISLTTGGTVTFAPGAGAVPSSVSTYNYRTPGGAPAPVPASWYGVGGLSQGTYGPTANPDATTVTVTQTAQQALLTWQRFDVGAKTTLDFDQSAGGASAGQWVAINKVAAGVAPSQILGSIQAPGQVYVINQNGVLFGSGSQVNVGDLVVSSLPINDGLTGYYDATGKFVKGRGLLNNPDYQFLFSQLDVPAGTRGPTPAFRPQENSPAPGANGANGGVVARVDSAGSLSFVPATGQDGDIAVQAGARLSSLATAQNVGGRVALVGPNVDNAGVISTPDGQTILAAGLQAGFQAHNTNDPTLRGLDVFVGSIADPSVTNPASTAGTATNRGLIGTLDASGAVTPTPGASAIIAGAQVNQNGVIDLSTSVNLNSRVDLLADYGAQVLFNGNGTYHGASGFYPTQAGDVSFGAGSLTSLTPALSSSATVVGTSVPSISEVDVTHLALSSIVNVQGLSIEMGDGATLLANSANVPLNTNQPALALAGATLTSGVTFDAGGWTQVGGNAPAFYNRIGTVTLNAGSVIDVSGSQDVAASVADNIIKAQFLGSELADSPLQRNGPLDGQTIYFDLRDIGVYDGKAWIGTPLADVSGYVNLVQRNVGELTTNGGTVGISAGQSVNLSSGSEINVAGGWIDYAAATVQTTRVVTNGRVLDLAQATPDLVYQGTENGFTTSSAKWGVSQNYTSALETGAQFEPGYVQGGGGGAVTLTAPSLVVAGNLYGNAVAGARQRNLPSLYHGSSPFANQAYLPTIEANLAAPTASRLTLNLVGEQVASSGVQLVSPTPADIVFQPANGPAAANPFAGSGHPKIDLSSDLVNTNGFGNLSVVNADGNIAIPAGVSLTASPNGSLAFQAANLLIDGSLTSPGGSLIFTVDDRSPYIYQASSIDPPSADPTRGKFTLGSGASLDVAGLVVDDLPNAPGAGMLPLVTGGGAISIAAYTAGLAAGSSLDVSGGAAVSRAGAVAYGNGGSLTILAGSDPNSKGLVGGRLQLGSTLRGYSGGAGGSLTLLAPLVQIGGTAADSTNALLLSPYFFDRGGFANFTIEGLGEVVPGQPDVTAFLPAVSIASGVSIDPIVQSWTTEFNGAGVTLTAITPPLASQRAPANLTFQANDITTAQGTLVVRGDFVLGSGATVATDPGGTVSIIGSTIDVQGSILAPAGKIALAAAKNSSGLQFADDVDPLVTVNLGAGSVLSTEGAVELTPNAYGYTTGKVLPGGSISVSGNLLAQAGSMLDVSGASGLLDEATGPQVLINSLRSSPYTRTREVSGGGQITLSGGQELFSAATLLGAAGGAGAAGGSLVVSSGIYLSPNNVFTSPLDTNLLVIQSGATFLNPVNGQAAIGTQVAPTAPLSDVDGNPIEAYFAADPNLFSTTAHGFGNGGRAGGFEAFTLPGTVEFSGSVAISARQSLNIGSSGIIEIDPAIAHSTVTLTAPYVALGQTFQGPLTANQQNALQIFPNTNGQSLTVAPLYAADETLTVNASTLADIGNLSLQNIGQLNFNTVSSAPVGDIRGDGTLDVAGSINLNAAQIYPPTETTFTIAAYDVPGVSSSGSIRVTSPNQPPPALPLSGGATLDLYASNICQGGVLRAPVGTINLGSGVIGSNPIDPLSGQAFAPTQNLTLASGSITSVSAVDPGTGQGISIPYGTLLNGVSWIDPAGNNITVAGNGSNAVPAKAVNVAGVDVIDQAGATIDLRGGGDLYANRFVPGTGGSKDILAATTSFAVLPDYSAAYAPDGGYNQGTDSTNAYSTGAVFDPGYTNPKLGVGEKIYLQASTGLAAGFYTLLPARYALLPGAFLITPESGTPLAASTARPDGSNLVAGYTLGGLDGSSTISPAQPAFFEVASQAVIRARAEYTDYSANTFLRQSAAAQGSSVIVPLDAGQLVLAATRRMTIQGTVDSQGAIGGSGGQVDLASTSNILLTGPNTNLAADLDAVSGPTLVLDSSNLSAFGAESLLIGGYRSSTAQGTGVTVLTNDLVIDNAGASTVASGATRTGLSGPDIVLVSNRALTFDPGAEVVATGTISGSAETLLLGHADTPGSGDGVVVRASADSAARILRSGVTANIAGPALTIGAGVTIAGSGLTLDSTSTASLDPGANLGGSAVSIDSGQIDLALDGSRPTSGLVLSSAALDELGTSAQALSLLSYSSIDLYGSGVIGGAAEAGGNYRVQNFALHADEILGHDAGTATLNARQVSLDNSAGGVATNAPDAPTGGALIVNAETVQLGGGAGATSLALDGYATVDLNASGGVVLAATAPSSVKDASGNPVSVPGAASLTTAGALQVNAPLVVGATGANVTITAAGNLTLASGQAGSAGTVTGGLGGSLSLIGAAVAVDDTISLTSGTFGAKATGAGSDVRVGGTIDVGGTAKTFGDLTDFTPGGKVTLTSASGSVRLDSPSQIDVAAPDGGGDAGSLTVVAEHGTFIHRGILRGRAGIGGYGGSFSADVATEDVSAALSSGVSAAKAGNDLTPLETLLDTGGFDRAQSIRVRGGTVDGTTANDVYLSGNTTATEAHAANYNLSVDTGSIVVTGTIDASNVAATDALGKSISVGGTIGLEAGSNVVLASGALLKASGRDFSNAGKGGAITLRSGATRFVDGSDVTDNSGSVQIAAGSTIDLRVAANDDADGTVDPSLVAAHAAQGDFSGTLAIEAPRVGESDVQVGALGGTILGASSLAVVANRVYDAANYGDGAGTIGGNGSDLATAILTDGNTFLGANGNESGVYAPLASRLFAGLGTDARAVANVEVGAEIIDPAGDLTLTSDWNLSDSTAPFRFGPNGTSGVLTFRAAGNLVFAASLSDGFTAAQNGAALIDPNPAVPVNDQSWSYRLVAGADFGSADSSRVLPGTEVYDPTTGLAVPGTAGGSVEVGVFVTSANGTVSLRNGQAATIPEGDDQVIRTGTGDIAIAAAGDVLLQNQFATIYTAGTQAPALGNFDVPIVSQSRITTAYSPQYSYAGGDVTISAQGNIAHVTRNNGTDTVILDSEKELPTNWLYRRGYVVQTTDPSPGSALPGQFGSTFNGDIGSTSWWVDFGNFFEGVGALGGGNVVLEAGHNVSNVDAVVPTNTRVPYENAAGNFVAADQTPVELGGGNLFVRAVNDIDAGAYYVERGQGTLAAGDRIVTNYTRSPSTEALSVANTIDAPASWLPTTLFLGKGSFDVTAQSDLLLGPVANPFLLPQGVDNTYWDKSYFSTYATSDAVNVASLTGVAVLREETSPGTLNATPLLQAWYNAVDLLGSGTGNTATVSNYQPWLNTTETSITPFSTVGALSPASFDVTASSGDLDLVGNLTLSPSPTGTINLAAAGSINGLQANGTGSLGISAWSSATIDLSDADPSAIPGVVSPYAYENQAGLFSSAASRTVGGSLRSNGVTVPVSLDLGFIDSLFAESGSSQGNNGVLETKQQLHASLNNAPLHAGDLNPVHLYAAAGDISGLTLFSGKAARVVAGQDITDVALYIQNVSTGDLSLVAAGRDVIPYDAEAPLRVEAQSSGNQLDSGQIPLDGDLQIGGPGTFEVLAGRNLNLGDGPNNADGTGVGLTSIGQERNPVLPFAGADIVAAAGLAPVVGLEKGRLDFTAFDNAFLDPATGGAEAAIYLPKLGALMGLPADESIDSIRSKFDGMTAEAKNNLALDLFYLVLRDSGRDHLAGSGRAAYPTGFAAIEALFPGNPPGTSWPGQGNISLTSREIKTTSGGNISLLVPGGRLDVGLNVSGVPPLDQGILTEDGGNISIFGDGNVNVGTSRIFTLNGGNVIIWSTNGNIDAGASSKTVQSAPPTRVLVDPQSGAVQTDLAGLATGGGIGVLEATAGAPPSDVDLIAPSGTVNAGDAGIRSSGNLNIAAVRVLNASNIQVGGKSTGVPTATVPNTAALAAASQASGSADNAARATTPHTEATQPGPPADVPSLISVEVIGYGTE